MAPLGPCPFCPYHISHSLPLPYVHTPFSVSVHYLYSFLPTPITLSVTREHYNARPPVSDRQQSLPVGQKTFIKIGVSSQSPPLIPNPTSHPYPTKLLTTPPGPSCSSIVRPGGPFQRRRRDVTASERVYYMCGNWARAVSEKRQAIPTSRNVTPPQDHAIPTIDYIPPNPNALPPYLVSVLSPL